MNESVYARAIKMMNELKEDGTPKVPTVKIPKDLSNKVRLQEAIRQLSERFDVDVDVHIETLLKSDGTE